MTAQEMSEKILERVARDVERGGASMFNLIDDCGPAARGDLALTFCQNLVLANGISSLFEEAFRLAEPKIKMTALPPLLVHTEPRRLLLPIATRIRDHKKPHWLPVAVLPKTESCVGR